MTTHTVETLDDEWRRRCAQDETLARLEPPTDSPALVEAVLQRIRPNSDHPEVLLASTASGFGAAGWRSPLRVLMLQVGLLVHSASEDDRADPDLVLRAHRVVCAHVAEAASEAYVAQAETDPLTELSNRRRYETLVEEQQTTVEPALTVAAIDLDGLKSVNDQQGHDAGDEYLRRFAGELRAFGVQNGCDVFRFGGDEFAVLSRDLPEDRLRELLEHLRTSDGVAPFSLGIAHADDPGDFKALMSRADVQLYEEKRARKDAQEPS